MEKYDFTGWATRNDIKCADGRTIKHNAFKDCDGMVVPIVWNHDHKELDNVLGHALLENRDEGVYTYGTFNDSKEGQAAKLRVDNGDITALSIYANKLKHNGADVIHGMIREVSLVIAGANPGAFIDATIKHGEDSEEEAVIYTDEEIALSHSETELDSKQTELEHAECATPEQKEGNVVPEEKKDEISEERTLNDVVGTFNEEQKLALQVLVGMALEENANKTKNEKGDTEDMKHNVFETDEKETTEVLSHSDEAAIFSDVKRYGSLKDSALAHGIDNIDYLFPEAQTMTNQPEFIKRDDSWVANVMGSVHHTPFSKIKSVFANITADEARAKGYIKGNLKQEEVFSLLKRSTTPTTVYKKQKLDRDDMIDITSFDVAAMLRSEMRGMLNEELARAFLVGDGRLASSDDKINEDNIRPIWKDSDLFVVRKTVTNAAGASDDTKARALIKSIIKARKDYKGSGNPICYTTEENIINMLLIEDTTGRMVYDSVAKLATVCRVKEFVAVPVMEGLTRTADGHTYALEAIVVNLTDYNVGADKGGEMTMMDAFDIDYNQQKYLIEARCSGALTKPYSAIVVESTNA